MKELIEKLKRLRAEATQGEWYISALDGAWAAAVDSPILKELGGKLGTSGGGPESPIGENDFSSKDEAYALACVNATPLLIAEVEQLRAALQSLSEHEPSWSDDFLRARSALIGVEATLGGGVAVP